MRHLLLTRAQRADNVAKVTIFAPTFVAGTTPKYVNRKAKLVTAVATALGLAESDITTQLYDAKREDNFANDEETEPNLETASGKVFLTYNPDIFKDGSMAAYQVWGGAQVNNVDGTMQKQANSAINTPMMSVSSALSLLHYSTSVICKQ